MSEVFDISFACPFFLPVQSFSCFSPIFVSLSLLSLVVFVIVFSSLIWLIVYICGLPFILSLSAVARHDAWSQIVISIILCFAISHHVYESIFNWLALPSGCCCCCRMAALLLPPPSLLSVFFSSYFIPRQIEKSNSIYWKCYESVRKCAFTNPKPTNGRRHRDVNQLANKTRNSFTMWEKKIVHFSREREEKNTNLGWNWKCCSI